MDSKTVVLFVVLMACAFHLSFVAAAPTGPSSINITANETWSGSGTGAEVNVSGGYISSINITAISQNPHWKAFVGWVSGQFTLDDSSGSTIYDWTISTIGGEVYATRNSSTISWENINCSNSTYLEAENVELSLLSVDDNITATFGENPINHSSFTVGANTILENTCPTLNTYVDNASQATEFEEVILYDGASNVYATILEEDGSGYDEGTYDFQMLVPENGSSTWTGSTAYYLYVELS